jgi:hypothetical protein
MADFQLRGSEPPRVTDNRLELRTRKFHNRLELKDIKWIRGTSDLSIPLK